jgi:ATP/ADP translocase
VALISRVRPEERVRWVLLALLFFMNAVVAESNDVVATSGFVSNVGSDQLLWVWAADMLVVMLTSGVYSLVVDRTAREKLAVSLFIVFSAAYLVLFVFFLFRAPDWISYPLLTVVNDQQWLVLPILLWALANDLFSVAEAKRLFPLLGLAAFAGSLSGNALVAALAGWLAKMTLGSVRLLVFNSGLLLLMAATLALASRRVHITTHQSRQDEKVLDTLREGLDFVREVPSYRYLCIAMVFLGIGLNVVEYQLIVSASQAYSQTARLETFFATTRAFRTIVLFLLQGLAANWLLKRLDFKRIFTIMPAALLSGLIVAFAWPSLVGAVIGEYLARTTLQGIDEPARRAFLGLVPDERRGRVSAFMDGYLYPAGSIVSCLLVQVILITVRQHLLVPQVGRALYFGLAGMCTAVALWAIARFRVHYDVSMLNWRLRRRQRKSVLSNLEL